LIRQKITPTINSSRKYVEEIEYKEKPNTAALLDFLIRKGVMMSKR
jgi:hypothetical protein